MVSVAEPMAVEIDFDYNDTMRSNSWAKMILSWHGVDS